MICSQILFDRKIYSNLYSIESGARSSVIEAFVQMNMTLFDYQTYIKHVVIMNPTVVPYNSKSDNFKVSHIDQAESDYVRKLSLAHKRRLKRVLLFYGHFHLPQEPKKIT